MKVQAKTGNKEVFNLEATVARAFIAAGTHVEYIAPEPVRTPNTTWSVGWLPAQHGYPNEPAITANCSTCGSKAVITGRTAHHTQVLRHCGVTETVPRHIAAQYAGMQTQIAERQETKKESAEVKKPAFLNVF